jgi:hypothetical protein
VLLYRAATMIPTLLIGLLAGVTWKRYRPDYPIAGPAQDSKAEREPPGAAQG